MAIKAVSECGFKKEIAFTDHQEVNKFINNR
jgi:hypothetical protein